MRMRPANSSSQPRTSELIMPAGRRQFWPLLMIGSLVQVEGILNWLGVPQTYDPYNPLRPHAAPFAHRTGLRDHRQGVTLKGTRLPFQLILSNTQPDIKMCHRRLIQLEWHGSRTTPHDRTRPAWRTSRR